MFLDAILTRDWATTECADRNAVQWTALVPFHPLSLNRKSPRGMDRVRMEGGDHCETTQKEVETRQSR